MIEIVGLQLPKKTEDEKGLILRIQAEVECWGKKYGVYYEFTAIEREFYSEFDYPLRVTLDYCHTMIEPIILTKKFNAQESSKLEQLMESYPKLVLFSLFKNRAYEDRTLARIIVADCVLGLEEIND